MLKNTAVMGSKVDEDLGSETLLSLGEGKIFTSFLKQRFLTDLSYR